MNNAELHKRLDLAKSTAYMITGWYCSSFSDKIWVFAADIQGSLSGNITKQAELFTGEYAELCEEYEVWYQNSGMLC